MFAFVATEILRLFVIRWKLTKAHFLLGAQGGVVTRLGCIVRSVTSVEGMNPYSFCSLLSLLLSLIGWTQGDLEGKGATITPLKISPLGAAHGGDGEGGEWLWMGSWEWSGTMRKEGRYAGLLNWQRTVLLRALPRSSIDSPLGVFLSTLSLIFLASDWESDLESEAQWSN